MKIYKKITKNILMVLFLFFIASCGCHKKKKSNFDDDIDYGNYKAYISNSNVPQKFEVDLVPDEKSAIKIADIIWDARYGKPKGVRDFPYTVLLENGKIWYVKTNLQSGFMGQVLHIKINKNDGKILYLWSEL